MTQIGKNIRKIRSVKGISQAAFAELFQLTRASVGAYEEGRAEPKLNTIIQIADYFGISVDIIIKKELTVNELHRFDIFKNEKQNKSVLTPKKQILTSNIVSAEHLEAYLKQCDNHAFIETLDHVSFPSSWLESQRIFQLTKSDKVVFAAPIESLEYVFAKKMSMSNAPVHDYLIGITEEALYFGRGKWTGTHLQLFRSGEDISLLAEELKECWIAVNTISKLKQSSMDLLFRVEELEKRVALLES